MSPREGEIDKELLQQGVELMTRALNGQWRDDPNLRETPQRVVRSLEEQLDYDPRVIDTELASVFPTKNTSMVIVCAIQAFGVCAHHLLPIEYVVDVAYIPKRYAVGLSKIARAAMMMCKRLSLQEEIAQDLAQVIHDRLGARGTMVVLRGKHGCMRFRGVRQQESWVVTSAVTGVFRDPKEIARQEFLSLTQRW